MNKTLRRCLPGVLAAFLLLLPGCFYTNISVPLDTDLQETDLGDKVGRSEYQVVLGLFAWGDAGMQAAAEDGGITTLKHADLEIFSVLGFVYYRQRTDVYGK